MTDMKLAFTTLGCPEWNIDTIISRAVAYGFDGVDFRGLQEEMRIYELPEFSTNAIETAERFNDAKLNISCFSSSARIFSSASERSAHLEEVKHYAKLCQIFGTKYIRVFGGSIGNVERTKAITTAALCLQKMGEIADEYNVTILLETHDDWTNSSHVNAIIEKVNSDAVGVLWDIHHPYRMEGEDPAGTLQNIGKWVQYTHWKDSYSVGEEYHLCLLGGGDVPLKQIFNLLKKNSYKGYLTFEWEKKWHPEIDEPEVHIMSNT
jgi:sugar phosphate isomerase/epimerase